MAVGHMATPCIAADRAIASLETRHPRATPPAIDGSLPPLCVILRTVGAQTSWAKVGGRRTSWALIAAITAVALALSTGVASPLSVDTWALLILAGPALAVTLVALVTPTPAVPSSALLTRPGQRGQSRELWRWFFVPYAVPLLTPLCMVAAEYLGAGVSAGRTSQQGLGPVLLRGPELGWYLPLVGLLFGGLLGWVGIMVVAVPVKVLARLPRLWKSDRTGAMRLGAYAGVVLGLWLTACAHGVVFLGDSNEDTGRLAVLRDELELLLGGAQAGVPFVVRLMAWGGVLSISAAGVIVWRLDGATKRRQSET